jgi:hypothetical protein
MSAHGTDTWIETTSYQDSRTVWLVRHQGVIVKVGETHHDPSGLQAFDIALVWARMQYGDASYNWKHHRVRLPRKAGILEQDTEARKSG